jgi:hypothetical protein
MTDYEEIALVESLPKGSRRALLSMSPEYSFPGRQTFNANAAFTLYWSARSYGGLAEYVVPGGRRAYRLTPLGERIRDRLALSPVSPV